MSLVYCKSQQYLRNTNNDNITSNQGSLAYSFVNEFKNPIKITPKSTIELISADLSVKPNFKISDDEKNNSITYGIGSAQSGSLQKVSKITDGEYNEYTLTTEIQNEMNETQNLDLAEWDMDFNDTGDGDLGKNKFKLTLKNQPRQFNNSKPLYQSNLAPYEAKTTRMGLSETTTIQDGGIGTTNNILKIENKVGDEKPYTLLKSLNYELLSASSTDKSIPPVLISNAVSPSDKGLMTACGEVNVIVRPKAHYTINPTTFLSGASGKLFQLKNGSSVVFDNLAFQSYTGSNDFDIRAHDGTNNLYLKFITAQSGNSTPTSNMSHYTITNLDTPYLPFGHFLIANDSDAPISSTLANNQYVFQLPNVIKGSITGWINYLSNAGGTFSFVGKDTASQSYIQSSLTISNLPFYGSVAVGVSRGEAVLQGVNQVQTGLNSRHSKVNITNTPNTGSNIFTDNNIPIDYLLQLIPDKSGGDMYVNTAFGVQQENKVCGEDGWIVMSNSAQTDANKLKTLFPSFSMGQDNILLTIKTYNNNCVAMYISHDLNGDLDFNSALTGGVEHIADTKSGLTNNDLGMGLCEMSAPFMPMIFTSSDYIYDIDSHYIFGTYSNKSASTHNLAKLNNYMTTNWGNNQQIPPRQTKTTITDICVDYNLVDEERSFNPNGFAGQTAEKTFTLPKGSVGSEGTAGRGVVAVRTNYFENNSEEGDVLTTELGMNYLPSQRTFLGNFLGFDSLLSQLNDDADVFERFSENPPNYNNSENFIVNCSLGNITGNNSATTRTSKMVAVIPDSNLTSSSVYTDRRSYRATYPLPVDINNPTEQNINNFQIQITNDDGLPSKSLKHPSSFLFKITK